jgi:hypothetical protein
MSDIPKREIRSEALHYVGDAKIGKLTGNGGTYPQLRLPKTHAHLIGKKTHLFEITKDGQTAFLISTAEGLNQSTEGLNQVKKLNSRKGRIRTGLYAFRGYAEVG